MGHVSIHKSTSIQSKSDATTDPLACNFDPDSKVGRRVLKVCNKWGGGGDAEYYDCWVKGTFRGPKNGDRKLVDVIEVRKLDNRPTRTDSNANGQCIAFEEEVQFQLPRGTIVQSKAGAGEGMRAHKYMAVVLYYPVCFKGDPNDKLTFIEVSHVAMKWLGYDVMLTGKMVAGDAWRFEVKHVELGSE